MDSAVFTGPPRGNQVDGLPRAYKFFEDFSRSCGQILVLARFKIISDQCASDGPYGTSSVMRGVFRKLLQSFGHDTRILETVNES